MSLNVTNSMAVGKGDGAVEFLCVMQPPGRWNGVRVRVLAPSPEKERLIYYSLRHQTIPEDGFDLYWKLYRAAFPLNSDINWCEHGHRLFGFMV